MKKNFTRLIVWATLILAIIFLLNISVTIRQGVNFRVKALKMPLYLKGLDFFDRHYNYRVLTSEITRTANTDEEKVFNLFEWAFSHIQPQPAGLPIVDDHVWHIIVRGYGAGEQSSDVFTTLCNYAGFNATYSWVKGNKQLGEIAFSFVRISGRWVVLDQYRGIYFKNKAGKLADIEELKTGEYLTGYLPGARTPDFDYGEYFKNILSLGEIRLGRGSRQSPFKRFSFEVEKWLKLNKR